MMDLFADDQLRLPVIDIAQMRDGASPAFPAMEADHIRRAARPPSAASHIERRAHPKAAGIDAVRPILGGLAIAFDQTAAHFLDKVADRRIVCLRCAGYKAQRLRFGTFSIGLANPTIRTIWSSTQFRRSIAFAQTSPGHRVPAPWAEWPERRFGSASSINILVEISPRCGLHTERAAPQRNFVEIKLKNLLLGQHMLDAASEDHFLQLAGDRIFVANQNVLGHLLGDGRAALGALARAEFRNIVDNRAGKPAQIDTAMSPERRSSAERKASISGLGKSTKRS